MPTWKFKFFTVPQNRLRLRGKAGKEAASMHVISISMPPRMGVPDHVIMLGIGSWLAFGA